MTFLDLVKFLVSIGLSPLEIGTAIVCVVLYMKAESLDASLHKCLDETPQQKQDRETLEKRMKEL